MDNFKDTFRCMLKVCSPVHLGCDEVYEPMGFVVDEENKQLKVFDPIDFISDISDEDRSKFSNICKTGSIESILEIFKFLSGRKVEGRAIDLCASFVAHYRKILGIRANEGEILRNLNQFQISRTAFKTSDDRPYIPGSAVKGAIRTAYLNAQNKKMHLPKEKNNNELQNKLLENRSGKIDGDPFRLLKVSDFMPVGKIRTKIVYTVNKKKKESPKEPQGPYQILEVIEPGAVFTGEISVEKPQSEKFIKKPLDLGQLLKALIDFYGDENARECDELNAIGVEGMAFEKNNLFIPLRIGRHSGAESLTIKGHRNIRIRLGGSESVFLSKATTVWLASETEKGQNKKGLKPFGWVQMEEMTGESEKANHLEESKYLLEKRDALQERAEKIALMKEEEERKVRDAEMRSKEADAMRAAEEKRRAELASMSAEELLLSKFDEGTITEEEANIAFKKIDEFPKNMVEALARKLKNHWIAQKKWTKKEVGKQWKKIRERNQKIDGILGE